MMFHSLLCILGAIQLCWHGATDAAFPEFSKHLAVNVLKPRAEVDPTLAWEQKANYSNRLQVRLAPASSSIILVGQKSSIHVSCDRSARHHSSSVTEKDPKLCVVATPYDPNLVKVLHEQTMLRPTRASGSMDRHHNASIDLAPLVEKEEGELVLLGLQPGTTLLDMQLLQANDNNSLVGRLSNGYTVTVVQRMDVVQDAFMYVLSVVQILVLMMLGWRMRNAAVREVLRRPCVLIAAILCQAMLMPLVCLGWSLAVGLPVHGVVALLLAGCCPTGVLSPMFAVLQQAHVELAIVLVLVETAAAFGAMPLWLFTYGHFLGLGYSQVSFPYLHIAGALGAVAGPILAGLCLKRCTPRNLPNVDKAIQPTCLLLILVACTVRVHAVWHKVQLLSWRLMVGAGLVPLSGAILGGIATAVFRHKLPEVKTVAVVTALQNTLLATVILQTSFPPPDASLMGVAITCLEITSLGLMVVLYIAHVALWLGWARYRAMHDSLGLSGAYHSIGDRIVRSMIKAGEITMRRRSQQLDNSVTKQHPKKTKKMAKKKMRNKNKVGNQGKVTISAEHTPTPKITQMPILVPDQKGLYKCGTIGFGRRSLSGDMSHHSQQSLSLSTPDLSKAYFADVDLSDSPKNNFDDDKSDHDSLNIDYSMLTTASRIRGMNQLGGNKEENMATPYTDPDEHGKAPEDRAKDNVSIDNERSVTRNSTGDPPYLYRPHQHQHSLSQMSSVSHDPAQSGVTGSLHSCEVEVQLEKPGNCSEKKKAPTKQPLESSVTGTKVEVHSILSDSMSILSDDAILLKKKY